MKPLKGVSVLVTRPQAQAEHLAVAIENNGGIPIRAPMLIIGRLQDDVTARTVVTELATFDIAIFVSKNAAEFGIELVSEQKQSLEGSAVFAVGHGTSGRLQELGIRGVEAPTREFSSEGLLRLDGLSADQVHNKRIVIFRGAGGREHLARTLEKRGAEVVYCECYERRKPDTVLAVALRENGVKEPDIGFVTSIEALDNLARKIGDEELEFLFDMQMLVVGSRIGQEVESLGFTNPPLVVENPADESIIKTLIHWADENV